MFKGLIVALVGGVAFLIGNQVHTFDSTQKEQAIVYSVKTMLDYVHYSPKDINDDFSLKFYDEYLNSLDGTKRFLIQEDIDQLALYKTEIDNQILDKKLDFFDLSNSLILKRIEDVEGFYEDLLDTPFNFDEEENIELDPEKKSWAKNIDDLKLQWRKLFKYEVLSKVYNTMESKKDSVKSENKSFEEVEKESREKVIKSYSEMFERLDKVKRDDRFDMYVNTLTNLFDPHTEYFSPKEKEDFDIKMQGKLEGIGARLQNDKDYTKIVEIIPGGPAWKGDELKANDIILKVAEGDSEEYVDLTGMRIDDVVGYIRGKKGTLVKLEVKKPDGSIKVIKIIRDEVILDEGKAKSLIIDNSDTGDKIGFIRLPSFYSEFNNDGNNCSDDIEREIEKLKANNVDGIVIDLRFNGGGSLTDVVKIAGFFIERGPIVQVKPSNEKPYVHNDLNSQVLYNGPMVILVNEMSASASEILAAALQDYNRAIIMGSKATFGKGTVQRFFDLDNLINGSSDVKPLGNLKATTQKFYRIDGGSTQLKGVESDIVIPDNYMYMDIGEREFDTAMPWDKIAALNYSQDVYNIKNKSEIVDRSNKRIEKDSVFNTIQEKATILKQYSDNTLMPLNYSAFKKESEKRKETEDFFNDKTDVEYNNLILKNMEVDLPKINMDSSRIARNQDWLDNTKKDAYVDEAVNVIHDMRELNK